MSEYLVPLLNPSGQLNTVFNPHDFQYQFEPLNYVVGDTRYTKKTDYNTKMTLLDASFNAVDTDITAIEGAIINISYDASNNRTSTQDVNSGMIYQADGKKIIQSSGASTTYNYLQNTSISNLNVTGTLSIPSGTTINGATYNNNIIITDPAYISQSGSGINQINSN